jgi:hypothetical protein
MQLHEHLISHLKKASEHHADVAVEHRGFAELEKSHAASLENDDPIRAAHHREKGVRHAALAKLHLEHCEHCKKAAQELGSAFGDTTKTAVASPDLQKLVSSN